MIFIFIRAFPFLMPLVYGLLLKLIFVFAGRFFWPWLIALSLNFLYFLFIFLKKKKGEALVFMLHGSVLITVGFVYLLFLSSPVFINLFLAFWSLLYFLYLESIFHYFYATKKVLLLNLKNIISYVNLITFFFAATFFIDLYIFLNFSLWLIFPAMLAISFMMIVSQLRANGITSRKILAPALVLSFLIVEILAAVLFLSVSFYVSAIILSLLYYILTAFFILNSQNRLTKTAIWQYLTFTFLVLLVVSLTAEWL